MSANLSNLSREAKQVLFLADAESKNASHYYIGIEHLFIALCQAPDPFLESFMVKLGLEPRPLQKQVRAQMPSPITDPAWGKHTPLRTPRMTKVLQIANAITRSFQPASSGEGTAPEREALIFPTHLFLAIFVEGQSWVVQSVAEAGHDVHRLKSALAADLENASLIAEINPQNTPYLNRYGRDLTALARHGKFGRVIGREIEIDRIEQVLRKKTKNNIVLVGPAGVGKTCIVEGFAQKAVNREASDFLKEKRVVELDLNALVAGTRFRGDFEERLAGVIRECINEPETVLFVDELHNLVGAGAASGTAGADNILKPHLVNGDIKVIGATTPEEYRRYIEPDKALERRFEMMYIHEPAPSETLTILQGVKADYEEHHTVTISDEALQAAVELSDRYIRDRNFPDKAIDLLDLACAQASAAADQKPLIGRADIEAQVAMRAGIPLEEISRVGSETLTQLEEKLSEQIIGQERAIEVVAQSLRLARAGLRDTNKPQGVFLFLGPTGVGKTELAKALAQVAYNGRLLTFDMSEYSQEFSVSRLLGAPPGYVGHDQDGELLAKVRSHPHAVVLFDEIEKAHSSIYNTIFLQIFEEGRVTDSHGRVVDFTNTVIILTSNLGSEIFARKQSVGFGASSQEDTGQKIMKEVKDAFRPELVNRIDELVIFNPLSQKAVRKIIDKFVQRLEQRLATQGVRLKLDESAYQLLMKNGYDAEYGAREMDRTINNLVAKPLAEGLLANRFETGKVVQITAAAEDKLILETEPKSIPSEKSQ